MRKYIWKYHSWVGLICALALIIIGLTGSVLVFHQEITDQFHSEHTLNANSGKNDDRIQLSKLTEIIDDTFPDYWIRGWLINTDPARKDKVYLNRNGTEDWYLLYLDPFSSEHSPEPIETDETLYGWFVDLHYTFFADHIGMAIAGFFALAFLFQGLSGLYLHKPFFSALFRLRIKKSSRIFFSDLHKAIGIATIPMNLILGFTGAYWNLTHLVHEMIEHADESEEIPSKYQNYRTFVDDLDHISDTEIPGYQLNYIYFPTDLDSNYYLYGRHAQANSFNSLYGSHIWISAESGEVLYSRNLKDAGFWTKIVDTFEPLHFGDFGGITTKILWCISGFSPGALSITGILMFYKRKNRRKRTSKTKP